MFRNALTMGLAASSSIAMAEPPALVAPGGALDDKVAGAEVYLGTPEKAVPPPGKACAAAEAYLVAINAGRYRDAADLFASDAVLFEPMSQTRRGAADIRSFYEEKIGPMRPEVIPVAFLGGERECMMENAAKAVIDGQQRFVLVSINHFTMDDHGKIARMIAFVRPRRQQ